MPTVTTANEIELEPSSSTALTNVVNNTENTNRAITNGDVTSSNAFDGTVPSGTEINSSVVLAGANAPTDVTIDAAVPNEEEHQSVEQISGTNVNEKPNEQIVPTTTILAMEDKGASGSSATEKAAENKNALKIAKI